MRVGRGTWQATRAEPGSWHEAETSALHGAGAGARRVKSDVGWHGNKKRYTRVQDAAHVKFGGG